MAALTVNILTLNPGSSSLKHALYSFPDGAKLSGAPSSMSTPAAILENVKEPIDAVGCRVVHGGSRFVTPAIVDEAVLSGIRDLIQLAPLHNPIAVAVIEDVRHLLPGVPVVAVFDTAFHQTLPPVASTYAIPEELGIRRYGFHGISYAYIASRMQRERMIACHLGNGASVCALRNGKSVDTSMGFTPMEGLVMGTRSGDLDPGAILYLLRSGKSESEIDDLLNHKSGLLALSRRTGDVRELENDPQAELALEVFAYRIAKYIGAYAAVLGGLDCLIFTAGIGEHSANVRQRICKHLPSIGIELDPALNAQSRPDERRISNGRTEVWVIPTNEELEIARATYRGLRTED